MKFSIRAQCSTFVLCLGVVGASGSIAEEVAGEASITLSLPNFAEPAAQPTALLDYFVVGQGARALFEVIAADVGMRLDLSDKVNSPLHNARLTGTRDEVLDAAAVKLGLDWFAFNGVLYVSNRSEALTRIVRLGGLKAEKVLVLLTESGLAVERLDIKPSADSASLALSGPPKLLALAEAMIEGIPPVPVERIAETEARIVTIRRGNAAERVRLP